MRHKQVARQLRDAFGVASEQEWQQKLASIAGRGGQALGLVAMPSVRLPAGCGSVLAAVSK